VPVPNWAERRTLGEFAEDIGELLMDNWWTHITNDVFAHLTEARVCIITFALHTTQIVQILDVTVFSIRKRHSKYGILFGDRKTLIEFIMKVDHDFKHTIVKHNI
jgi:hypothetical protein